MGKTSFVLEDKYLEILRGTPNGTDTVRLGITLFDELRKFDPAKDPLVLLHEIMELYRAVVEDQPTVQAFAAVKSMHPWMDKRGVINWLCRDWNLFRERSHRRQKEADRDRLLMAIAEKLEVKIEPDATGND